MADKGGFIEDLDPAIRDLIAAGDRKRGEARSPVDDRRRRVKARTKARTRNRVMLDLPQDLTERLRALAEEQRIPMSQVAGFLLDQGLAGIDNGMVSFESNKVPSKSPKYDWNLEY